MKRAVLLRHLGWGVVSLMFWTLAGAACGAVWLILEGCGGEAAPEPDPFGWCCEQFCGLSAEEANPFEECTCWNGYIHPVEGTRGECKPLLTE